jgi:hypothetical protein
MTPTVTHPGAGQQGNTDKHKLADRASPDSADTPVPRRRDSTPVGQRARAEWRDCARLSERLLDHGDNAGAG